MRILIFLFALLVARAAVADDALDGLRARAEAGDPSAQFELAARYGRGDGVEADAEAMAAWLRRAAEGGLVEAQWALATLLIHNGDDAEDRAAGREWLQRAADQGHATALTQLGVEAADAGDPAAALDHFRRAAGTGDVDAQYGLALILRDGELGPKDAEGAAKWFRAAAIQGHAEAQAALGVALALGQGLDFDMYAAHFWLLLAGEAGGPRAASARRAVAAELEADERDALRARVEVWRAGAPAMPYAQGVMVYAPPAFSPDSPQRPYASEKLRDAVVVQMRDDDGIEPRQRLLLSTRLLSAEFAAPEVGPSAQPGVVLDLAADGSVTWGVIQHAEGYIEIDPARLDVRVVEREGAISGEIRNAADASIEQTGYLLDLSFDVPVRALAEGARAAKE